MNTKTFDPYDIKPAIAQTTIEALEADDVFQKAVALAEAVQALYPLARETPRWADLHDQAACSSASVALNFAQGLGKLKGFCQNDWLCARGELLETFAALSIGPDSFKALKPAAKELLVLLDARLNNLAERSDRHYWKN